LFSVIGYIAAEIKLACSYMKTSRSALRLRWQWSALVQTINWRLWHAGITRVLPVSN